MRPAWPGRQARPSRPRAEAVVEIVLVRHASTAWSGSRFSGAGDPPLSQAGIREAAGVAALLASTIEPRSRVVSSPLRRAHATADRIAAALGSASVEIDARWREADVGLAEGRTFDELVEVAPDVAAALADGAMAIDWPGGETHAALAARVAAAWTALLENGRPVVVVTHAGPLMHARAMAEGRPINATDLVDPAAAVRLEVAAGGLVTASVLPSRP